MPVLNIAWWNLENLFDAATSTRPPELAGVLKNELKGWTAAIRDQKIDRLAAIIKLMFAGAGPDLLGVAEAENEAVLKLLAARMSLPGRAYTVLNHPSPDTRGIDTSFIYDANTLTPSAANHFVVAKRRGTRDLFWATFQPKAGSAPFVAIANHWPARSEGQYESEPFRMMVAETASYVLERLFAQNPEGEKLPVVLMGDFNDEPFNRALEEYLLSSHDEKAVTRGRAPNVLNLMWPLLVQPQPGTYFFDGWNLLDQFLATKGLLLTDSKVRVDTASVSIFRPPAMCLKNGAPRRFGRPSKKDDFDPAGASDHFPITMTLTVK
jgi:endonuclease/exonuclease/phosphatase family metal-dependent hydrolase